MGAALISAAGDGRPSAGPRCGVSVASTCAWLKFFKILISKKFSRKKNKRLTLSRFFSGEDLATLTAVSSMRASFD